MWLDTSSSYCDQQQESSDIIVKLYKPETVQAITPDREPGLRKVLSKSKNQRSALWQCKSMYVKPTALL